MSRFNINELSDDMLKERLKEKASELNISEGELLETFVLEGLETIDDDNKYSSKNLSSEEIKQILIKDKEKDLVNGISNNQGSIRKALDQLMT